MLLSFLFILYPNINLRIKFSTPAVNKTVTTLQLDASPQLPWLPAMSLSGPHLVWSCVSEWKAQGLRCTMDKALKWNGQKKKKPTEKKNSERTESVEPFNTHVLTFHSLLSGQVSFFVKLVELDDVSYSPITNWALDWSLGIKPQYACLLFHFLMLKKGGQALVYINSDKL